MKRSMFLKNLSLLLLASVLSACSTTSPRFSVHSDASPDANMQDYKTFSWVSEEPMVLTKNSPDVSPLNADRIQTAIESSLTSKGYQQVELSEKPDFTVSFTVGSREKLNTYAYPAYYHRRDPWRWPYYYHEDIVVHQYTVGSLSIDVFDYESRKPVWHGLAQKQVISSDRNNPEPVIKQAVAAIMERFPN